MPIMAKGKSSVGVEMEFLLCVATEGQELTVPECLESSKGRPLVLRMEYMSLMESQVRYHVGNAIEKAVAKHRGTRVIETADEVESHQEAGHLKPYQDWRVKRDLSVHLETRQNDCHEIQRYYWDPVEVVSPAFWATEDTWTEIYNVVQAIRDEFWILTPRSAGLHFHLGHGKEYIPFRKLRRMAALIMAADPILVQLHPKHRRENGFCFSNRLYSLVAHGYDTDEVADDIERPEVEEEPEIPNATQKGTAESVGTSVARPGIPFKRGELEGYVYNEEIFQEKIMDLYRPEFPKPRDIPTMVREILKCPNAPTIAELTKTCRWSGDRPAYAFNHYALDKYRIILLHRDPEEQHKRTVELRQFASTMVPEEIVAYGKIMVRLCEFADEATLDELWRVVLDCTVGEEHGEWYDVFDLLQELGLGEEGKALVDSITRFRAAPEGEEDDDSWNPSNSNGIE
ncbi:putative amidoligase enzyme-domain-containing protein [Xylaria sp. CBS 124048]|nr:putative amidoligase enzyme-domain-containing protein [Xylaria sp. CBS 124048]